MPSPMPLVEPVTKLTFSLRNFLGNVPDCVTTIFLLGLVD
jgi:hypothetical protein